MALHQRWSQPEWLSKPHVLSGHAAVQSAMGFYVQVKRMKMVMHLKLATKQSYFVGAALHSRQALPVCAMAMSSQNGSAASAAVLQAFSALAQRTCVMHVMSSGSDNLDV